MFTPGRASSASTVFLVDGINLLSAHLQGMSYKLIIVNEKVQGMGDVWDATSSVGVQKAEVTQDGAFFRTEAITGIHAAFSGNTGVARVVCFAFAGNTIGQPMIGFKSVIVQDYEVLAQNDKLTKANVTYLISDLAENGVIVHALSSDVTDPAVTEPTNSVDHTAELTAKTVVIVSSNAVGDVITTATAHGLTTGDTVLIAGHTGSTPNINGVQTATVLTSTTFSIGVDITVGGTGGTMIQAKSNQGGAGYLEITALTLGGFTSVTGTFRHSDDNSTFVDLLVMTTQTTAPVAERKTVAGAVRRYLAFTTDFIGAGAAESVTLFAGFARY